MRTCRINGEVIEFGTYHLRTVQVPQLVILGMGLPGPDDHLKHIIVYSIIHIIHMVLESQVGECSMESFMHKKITEVDLSAFAYRLFHEDFSSIIRINYQMQWKFNHSVIQSFNLFCQIFTKVSEVKLYAFSFMKISLQSSEQTHLLFSTMHMPYRQLSGGILSIKRSQLRGTKR